MSDQIGSRRQPEADRFPKRATSTPAKEPSGSEEEGSYLQALFVTFWKPIFIMLCFLHIILAWGTIKLIWTDPIQYLYGVAALIVVPIAYFEIEYFARWMEWESGPIVDWRERSTILVVVGYSLALVLAIGLTVREANDRVTTQIARQQQDRQHVEERRLLSDPNVKRGMEILQAHQAKEQDRPR
jgi:hypothetical protein